jgi:hypothetical protein
MEPREPDDRSSPENTAAGWLRPGQDWPCGPLAGESALLGTSRRRRSNLRPSQPVARRGETKRVSDAREDARTRCIETPGNRPYVDNRATVPLVETGHDRRSLSAAPPPPPSQQISRPTREKGYDLRFSTWTVHFVDRAGDSVGLRGARFQAILAKSDSAEIGWTPCGTVPHFVPTKRSDTAGEDAGADNRSPQRRAPHLNFCIGPCRPARWRCGQGSG